MPTSHSVYPIIRQPHTLEYMQILCVDFPMTFGPGVTLLGFRGEADSVPERTNNIWSIPLMASRTPDHDKVKIPF